MSEPDRGIQRATDLGTSGSWERIREADLRLQRALRRQTALEIRRLAEEQLHRHLRRQLQGEHREHGELRRSHPAEDGARPGSVRWGDLDRLTPFSDLWGSERGVCVDRVFLEGFLERRRADIRGRVLEIEDRVYTERYGGDRVESADVLDIEPTNEKATWVADLRDATVVPDAHYDCLLFTQVLFLIPEIGRALEECRRLLRPGGVLLLTLPFASRVPPEYGLDDDVWRFTPNGVRRLVERHFAPEELEVEALGGTWSSSAFLYGLADRDLVPSDFERHDPDCPTSLCVRAVCPRASRPTSARRRVTPRREASPPRYDAVSPPAPFVGREDRPSTSPSVGVVIPCHDDGRTLREALASVAEQTVLVREVVIVDDGSAHPFTRRVLADLERDPRASGASAAAPLRIARTAPPGRPRGAGAARNLGATVISSDFLLFLDADDRLRPELVERALAVVEKHPDVDLVGTGLEAFGEADYVWTPPRPELLAHLVRGSFPISTLLRRAVFESLGGFDETLSGHEDWDLWLRALAAGRRVEVVEEPLLEQRVGRVSRYRGAIGRHRELKRVLLEKHATRLGELAGEVVLEASSFRRELEGHRCHLEHELERARARAEAATERISNARAELERIASDTPGAGDSAPVVPLDVGDLRGVAGAAGVGDPEAIPRWCRQRFVWRGLEVEGRSVPRTGRWLEIGESSVAALLAGSPIEDGGDRLECLDRLPIEPSESSERLDQRLRETVSGSYDVVVAWELLDRVPSVERALVELRRILKPEGHLVLSVAAAARVRSEHDLWRLVPGGLRRLLAEVFPPEWVTAEGIGNLQTSVAALCGLTPEALPPRALLYEDPDHPTLSVAIVGPPEPPGPPGWNEPDEATESSPGRRRGVGSGSLSASAPPSARVLCYHRVLEPGQAPVPELAVAPGIFERQLERLQEVGEVVPLAELLEDAARGRLDSGRPRIALTFDDCGRDALEHAAPLLVAAGLPATFFATSAGLSSPGPAAAGLSTSDSLPRARAFWWDRLARAERLGRIDARRRREMTEHLYPLAPPERDRLLVEWGLDVADVAPVQDSPLDAEGLRALDALPGIEVACHTRSHLALPHQERERLVEEICGNRVDLEVVLGRRVEILAWPFGECDDVASDVARRSGFRFALTVGERAVRCHGHPYRVPRYEVTTERTRGFDVWLAGWREGG